MVGLPHLQLLDGVAAAADHQPHLTGRDQHLLHRGAATVAVSVETGPVSAALHDLDQQPLGLPARTHTHKVVPRPQTNAYTGRTDVSFD